MRFMTTNVREINAAKATMTTTQPKPDDSGSSFLGSYSIPNLPLARDKDQAFFSSATTPETQLRAISITVPEAISTLKVFSVAS